MQAMNHENIVKLVGSYSTESKACIVISPWCDMSLSDYLSTPTPDKPPFIQLVAIYIDIMAQIAAGVSYIHNVGLTKHLNLKSENILLIASQVKIADFGLSSTFACNSHL